MCVVGALDGRQYCHLTGVLGRDIPRRRARIRTSDKIKQGDAAVLFRGELRGGAEIAVPFLPLRLSRRPRRATEGGRHEGGTAQDRSRQPQVPAPGHPHTGLQQVRVMVGGGIPDPSDAVGLRLMLREDGRKVSGLDHASDAVGIGQVMTTVPDMQEEVAGHSASVP